MAADLIPKSRTFSKRLVIACVVLAWVALFYSIYSAQASVAVAGFSFIATIAAGYMGVGHMDLRQLLTALKQGADYGAVPEPPPIEMRDA
ncbi:hypothetical protein [Mesorhizobium sp. ESP-6-2]|uniref:hypothetical protein n=1 Tax=Mesorhizobium sp. ESP-6-2 TaxID=2876625 RepID=UPI001CCBEBA2|nr:hypothetical protein [Mesorhizobium sp. ESP-6-2]MBZ9808111.1 hypothetical protein [Mesorhizobium sp. ESP-6-2]